MKYLNKHAISPVIASGLIFVVAVIAVVSFQDWYNEFSNKVYVDTEIKSSDDKEIKIDSLVGNNLWISSLKILTSLNVPQNISFDGRM